jgi:hypothetical protein
MLKSGDLGQKLSKKGHFWRKSTKKHVLVLTTLGCSGYFLHPGKLLTECFTSHGTWEAVFGVGTFQSG